jgi:hypothetical protein
LSTPCMRLLLVAFSFLTVLGCGGTTVTSGHTFACGSLMCNSATETCSIVNGHLPGQAATYACDASDGGAPSCGGASSATAAGQCGCYESPTGEVTSTECPP